jgi:hypothetical protein
LAFHQKVISLADGEVPDTYIKDGQKLNGALALFFLSGVKGKAIRSSVSGGFGKTRRQMQRQSKLSLLTINVNQNQGRARLNSSTKPTNGQQPCLPLLRIECGLMRIKRKLSPRFLAARDSSPFFAFFKAVRN